MTFDRWPQPETLRAAPDYTIGQLQAAMAEGDERARKIYETIGVYFGYQIAYYAKFYDIRHVLIMGRVTSGQGGQLLLQKAQEVLNTEYPELAKKIQLHIPDENSRRVGQSVPAGHQEIKIKFQAESAASHLNHSGGAALTFCFEGIPNAQRVFAKTRPIRVRNMKKF